MICEQQFFNCSVIGGEVKFKNEKDYSVPEDEVIMQPCTYYKDIFKYSDIPLRIAKAFNYWIQAPEDKFREIHKCIDIQLIGTILISDLHAERQIRQGKPTAHIIYGMPHVLNTCVFCTLPPWSIDGIDIQKYLKIVSKDGIAVSRLNSLYIQLVEEGICPNEKLYCEWAGYKTTLALTLLEIRLLQELYGNKPLPEFEKFVNNIRLFFTIIDECRRITEGNSEDIRIGNFSLPIIYAIGNSVDDGRVLLSIIRQKTKDEDLLKFALSVIKKSGALDYCKKKLHDIKCDILAEFKRFNENPLFDEFFDEYLIIPDEFEDVKWIIS